MRKYSKYVLSFKFWIIDCMALVIYMLYLVCWKNVLRFIWVTKCSQILIYKQASKFVKEFVPCLILLMDLSRPGKIGLKVVFFGCIALVWSFTVPVHVLQLFKREIFLNFFFLWTLFNTASSAALRFHCVGGCWDRAFDYVFAKKLYRMKNLWKTAWTGQAEHQVQTFHPVVLRCLGWWKIRQRRYRTV